MIKNLHITFLAAICIVLVMAGCHSSTSPTVAQPTQGFIVTPLTANKAIYGAPNIDTNLQDAWGLAYYDVSGTFWVSNAGSGVATFYDSVGKFQKAFPVNGPGLTKGSPTGIITLNGNFLFASLNGTLSQLTGFSDSTNIVSNRSATSSKFTSLAEATVGGSTQFYVANFRNQSIDLFHQDFTLNFQKPGNYQSQSYTPYDVQVIDTQLYVTYALTNGTNAVVGAGNGYIDIFDLSGNFRKNLVAHGALNSPYGMAIAPSSFGSFSGKLLVGNFGDGKINVYDPSSGAALGSLNDANGNPIVILELSSLVVANGTLYYTAAPNNFVDGVFGKITLP